MSDGERGHVDARPTDPRSAILDAIEETHSEELCGAPVGDVLESVLADPTIGLAEAMMAFRDLRITSAVYQPSPTTVARTGTEGSA
jgi:hypothetical protein